MSNLYQRFRSNNKDKSTMNSFAYFTHGLSLIKMILNLLFIERNKNDSDSVFDRKKNEIIYVLGRGVTATPERTN